MITTPRRYLLIGLIASALSGACASLPPSPNVQPARPVAALRAVGGVVHDPAGVAIPEAICRLQVSAVPDVWVSSTPAAVDTGYVLFTPIPASITSTHIECVADGFVSLSQSRRLRTPADEDLAPIVMERAFTPLPRLVAEGQHFRLATGGAFTAIETSDFNLLNRWQHGESIDGILRQRRDIGFNMLRVWTRYRLAQYGIGDFPDLDYRRLPAFLDLCARYGFYVELTAYTSLYDDQPDGFGHPSHWTQLVTAVADSTNVLLELVNENDQAANWINTDLYARPPTPILASHGSNGAEAWPVYPLWDYATFHTNGAGEEQRKIGHNAYEIWNGPTLTNETSRFPDVGMWRNNADPGRSAQLAFDSGAGAALLAAGWCFHSVAGKASVLFDAATEAVARAGVAGSRSVDLRYQPDPYRHGAEELAREQASGLLRSYRRGDSKFVDIRR